MQWAIYLLIYFHIYNESLYVVSPISSNAKYPQRLFIILNKGFVVVVCCWMDVFTGHICHLFSFSWVWIKHLCDLFSGHLGEPVLLLVWFLVLGICDPCQLCLSDFHSDDLLSALCWGVFCHYAQEFALSAVYFVKFKCPMSLITMHAYRLACRITILSVDEKSSNFFQVALSDFLVKVPLNFDQLEHHKNQSNGKSMKCYWCIRETSYHSNMMKLYPILHDTKVMTYY